MMLSWEKYKKNKGKEEIVFQSDIVRPDLEALNIYVRLDFLMCAHIVIFFKTEI